MLYHVAVVFSFLHSQISFAVICATFLKFICKQFSIVGQFPEFDVIMAIDF